MVSVYLLRHGETENNRQGIVQGSGLDAPLNEEGYRQARAFFEYYRDTPFDAAFVSELKRTRQTLDPWYGPDLKLIADRALDELSWGDLEGHKPEASDRELFLNTLKAWTAGQGDARIGGGESANDAWRRAERFWRELPNKWAGKQILICSHGRMIRVVLSMLLYGDLQNMERFKPQNTGLFRLSLDEQGNAEALCLNDIQHLNPGKA